MSVFPSPDLFPGQDLYPVGVRREAQPETPCKAITRARVLTRNASNTTGWTMGYSAMNWSRTS